MIRIFFDAWPLLLGMLLLMIGNGLQGTVLGLRGAHEGFDAQTMSWVMSAFFLGFLAGSSMTPRLIQRVGHVRVFAALGSLISAALILYAAVPNPIVWAAMRLLVGFCFAGVYVVAESWLNARATNDTRGQTLSLYVIVQMTGIVSAQALVNLGDPAAYTLFVVMSVLVSVSFAPILLTVSPVPVFETAKPMSVGRLFRVSPFAMVGTLILGGIFAAIFAMAPIYATETGLSVAETTLFIATIYVGGALCQFPLGWLSDRMDRRRLIIAATAIGAVITVLAVPAAGHFGALLMIGFVIGGVANPLYSLLIAYMNDYLEQDDMAAASGGLVFVNGLGAVGGPIAIGWIMSLMGPVGYFVWIAALFAAIAAFGSYRATQRATPSDTGAYAPVLAQATPVAVTVAASLGYEDAETEGKDAGRDGAGAPG
ncbi:MAG: MFS transporter [Pseudomonadota bacterium]